MTLLILLAILVTQVINQTSRILRSSTARIQSFQEARAGYESIIRKIGQATLQTYYDYYDAKHQARSQLSSAQLAAFVPASYDRISNLHLISGQAGTLLKKSPTPVITQTQAVFFQAPLGYTTQTDYKELDNALNACGYFLRFDDAGAAVPSHVRNTPGFKPRYRFRLMEMTQSTEQLAVYDPNASSANDWFVNTANLPANSRVISENVIALVLLPKLASYQDDPTNAGHGVSLAPAYNYNSRVPAAATTDPAWLGVTPAFPPDQFTAYPTSGVPKTTSRHHQMPPLMQVVMIVIDEASAALIQGNGITPPKALDFTATTLFTDASKLADDVQAVEDICNAKSGNLTGNTLRLNYRVFNSDILIHDAQWSDN